MPEGSEVKKFADILKHNVIGHTITKVNILKGRYVNKIFDGFNILQKNLPVKIISVDTKGKFTYLTLENTENRNNVLYLFNTLGLTGGWTLRGTKKSDFKHYEGVKYLKSTKRSKDCKTEHNGNVDCLYAYPIILEYISNNNINNWFERAVSHLNVEFELDNGMSFYFYDQLSFGTLKIIETKADLDKKLKELGPDMLSETTTFDVFTTQITKSINKNKHIGNVLVNQKLISGIGNYLRADGLWMAKISPFRKISDLNKDEIERIYIFLRALIWGDYDYKAAQSKGFINKDIKIPHDYQRDFFVYRHEKDLDGNDVKKEELFEGSQKRFIYWVPNRQT
jgi:formamidopyrimidine-DNA glycosylase